MKSEAPIVISLEREFNNADEKAIGSLWAKWLIYDVKIDRQKQNTQIAFFHSQGAASDLIRELHELFPNEHPANTEIF